MFDLYNYIFKIYFVWIIEFFCNNFKIKKIIANKIHFEETVKSYFVIKHQFITATSLIKDLNIKKSKLKIFKI